MNTPNPNPSPELLERARELLAQAYERADLICPAADVRSGNKIDWVREKVALDAVLAALSQTLPALGEVERATVQALNEIANVVLAMIEQGSPADLWSPRMLPALRKYATLATVAAANDEGVARKWFPHLCWAGEPMHEGQFREPWPMDEERTALAKTIFDGWYEGNEDWDSPHNDHLQTRAYFAVDAAIRLLSQGGGKA